MLYPVAACSANLSSAGTPVGKITRRSEKLPRKIQLPFCKSTATKLIYYDRFNCGDDLEMRCCYRDGTCWKVAEVRKLSQIDAIRKQLNASAQKVKKDQWVNKLPK